jgi:hypothetical protein
MSDISSEPSWSFVIVMVCLFFDFSATRPAISFYVINPTVAHEAGILFLAKIGNGIQYRVEIDRFAVIVARNSRQRFG